MGRLLKREVDVAFEGVGEVVRLFHNRAFTSKEAGLIGEVGYEGAELGGVKEKVSEARALVCSSEDVEDEVKSFLLAEGFELEVSACSGYFDFDLFKSFFCFLVYCWYVVVRFNEQILNIKSSRLSFFNFFKDHI